MFTLEGAEDIASKPTARWVGGGGRGVTPFLKMQGSSRVPTIFLESQNKTFIRSL